MDYQLLDNEKSNQYEFHIDGLISKIEYKKSDGKMYLTHTEVPKELAGRGIASSLVEKVLEDIQQKGLKIIPLCSFVAKYIQRHPEWEPLVLKNE